MIKELPAGSTLSHYRVVSKIGEGAWARFTWRKFAAQPQSGLEDSAADLAANQDRMRRFVQEAKAAAALNHPTLRTLRDW